VLLAGPAGAMTPDEWGMDDGIGVGPRVAGTPCLAVEAHQWADSVDSSGYALWCPPPAFSAPTIIIDPVQSGIGYRCG